MVVSDIILYFSLKYEGDWNKIYNSIRNLEEVDFDELKELKKNLKSQYVTAIDEDYPKALKNIYKPPYVLYYYGDISLVNKANILAIIGSRTPSSYGEQALKKILEDSKHEDFVVVSGLAKGIDTIAHSFALKNNIKTIGVLGTGIDFCYPNENFEEYEKIKNNGLLISEYPNKVNVQKEAFSFRNRIITGLSHFVLGVDIKERSGSLVSIRYALAQGKDIFTIPYSIFDESISNRLIQEGAKLITNYLDIVEEFK